ncbi:SGNH hydrolase-type esterase domain-containing protein [Absidia repens]|uniref:SGNH hydrolase-type esterase domain-containing protein n=1 Tax=Absidia repens TaxID=90262 RepID=A0A1X2IA10_9FUNG|nr:SGNH hydrolase-type esterase domain-containing protein [Absidia repens]
MPSSQHHHYHHLISFLCFSLPLHLIHLILLASQCEPATAAAATTRTRHLFRQVQSYQVLQRHWETNTAWVELLDGKQHELKVGGPYTVDDAQHVMVGDLWILAGQSNMEGYAFFDHHHQELESSYVFQSNESWGIVPASQPVHYLATSPRLVHHTLPDPTVADPTVLFDRGASLGPSFAHHYHQALDVPVGLIPCAHGGVTLQQWMKQPLDDANTTLYGAMLDTIRLVGGSVTGVLWYQGESDAVQLPLAQQYQHQFTQWLDQLRLDLPDTDCVFIFAQIGRTISTNTNDDADRGWTLVRQAQLDVFQQQRSLWRMALVSTLDATMDDYIHLSANSLRNVGRRMADAAVHLMKKDQQQQHWPLLSATGMTMLHLPYDNGRCWRHLLRLDFQHSSVASWLHKEEDNDRRIMGFTIHDSLRTDAPLDIIYSARVNANRHQIDLYLTDDGYQQLAQQEKGRFVLWYGYGKNPQCNLVTTDNQAALAFGPLSINVTPLPSNG